ncbi:hypothetical protein BKA59DRAFT_491628 [Fusarium tricinctum]|uniref:Peptidase M20 domain-containing protein 2 n=1 Tax=Fusarium tricinctum TaxID=61284 RepID=A0A8K0RW47_9HYPO|nr:hypothetical protein BKA59DRAFT_491628 [Fusarium tricinctum]
MISAMRTFVNLDNTVVNSLQTLPSNEAVREAIAEYVLTLEPKLRNLNTFVSDLGYEVKRHAYSIETSFEVIHGKGGRIVNFNAEYDALPGLGHACGHNLIATASVTGFLALAYVLEKFGIDGRVQLLGTPAEEDGGGKIALLNAGAYEEVDVSLMILQGTYHGVSAHAGATPWEGINALDALVSAYLNVSMLRQQILPSERIHGAIVEAPKPSSNAIPALTKTEYTARSPTIRGARDLAGRIRQCLEAGALATGCKLEVEEKPGYADLRINDSLCSSFQQHIAANDIKVMKSDGPVAAATDQGNVSYAIPALHAVIGIPADDGSKNHTAGFTKAAGTAVAYERTVLSGKAMAMTGWDVLTKDEFFDEVRGDFERDQKKR